MRFGTRTLLIAFAVVALWLSTFAGYKAAGDVRASIAFVGTSAAAFAAIYSRGSRRAFWSGFVGTLLVIAVNDNSNWRFVPSFMWYNDIARQWATQVPIGPLPPNTASGLPFQLLGQQARLYEAITATFWAMGVLALASVVGLVGAVIYRQCGRPLEHG